MNEPVKEGGTAHRDAYRPYVFAGIIYLAATLLFTWPLAIKLHDHVPDRKDTVVHIWKLAWGAHALSSPEESFWNGSIFYPLKNSNALADSQAGNLPFYWPVAAISDNPVLGHNTALILTFFLSALAMFALAYYWTSDVGASLVAGFVFGFHPFRLTDLPELHMLSWQWTPLTLLFLEKFLRHARWRHGLLAVFFYIWQLTSSLYLGYFLSIGIFLYLVIRFFSVRRGRSRAAPTNGVTPFRKLLPKLAIFSFLMLILTAIFIKPYLIRFAGGGLERSMKSIAIGSLSLPDDLLSTYYKNLLYGSLAGHFGGGIPIKQYFPGALVIILAVIGFRHAVVRARCIVPPPGKKGENPAVVRARCIVPLPGKKRENPGLLFGILMAVGFFMALGPYLVFWDTPTNIPMPYLVLMKILPGLKSIRIPARFTFLTIVGGSIFIAFGTSSLLDRFQGVKKKTAAAGIITLLLAAEFICVPIPLDPIPSLKKPPPVYEWLRDTPVQGAVLELPFAGTYVEENYMYMYHNIGQFRPTANGICAFIPENFGLKFQVFPNPRLIDWLYSKNIRILILHTDRIKWVPSIPAPESLPPYQRSETPWGWKYSLTDSTGNNRLIETTAQTLYYLKNALKINDFGPWLSESGCSELRIYRPENYPMDTIRICSMDVAFQKGESDEKGGLCAPDRTVLLTDLISNASRERPEDVLSSHIPPGSNGLEIINAPTYPYEVPKWDHNLLRQRGVRFIKAFGSDQVFIVENTPVQ